MNTLDAVSRIEGPNISLRLIQPSDADYVYGLRLNQDYNEHLSAVGGTAEDQRSWITGYKTREAAMTELYYIVERRDGIPCGTLRLYNIASPSFEWGSWILDTNKTRKAALESAVLAYRIAFDLLDLEKAVFDVRKGNTRTLAFHHRFGAIETRQDDENTYFTYPKSTFRDAFPQYWSELENLKGPAS
ncbi:MAG: GNAT family N-acetyltransferase [Paracoccaceae bacterium]